MSGLTLQLKGLEELQKRLAPAEIEKKVNAALASFGNAVKNDAVRLSPINEGRLRKSIFYDTSISLQLTVGANVDYAAYLEFGTRKFAASYVAGLPAEWQQFAAQYKGAGGGSFQEFVMRIYNWVVRKGVTPTPLIAKTSRKVKKATKTDGQKQMAYAIALKILREGIRPQPFLFPAYEKNRALLNKKLEL